MSENAPTPRDTWPENWRPFDGPTGTSAEDLEYTAKWWAERDKNGPKRPVESASLGSSSGSSQVRPQLSSSVQPSPYGGAEHEQFGPGFVPEPNSWRPLDLVALGQKATAPPDLVGLFYVGKNHLLSGETEALKTWLGLVAAAAEIAAGRGVLWVDGDDVGPGDILERLLLLGASEADVRTRFCYVRPDEPLEESLIPDVLDVVREKSCRLVVLDGFNPLLSLSTSSTPTQASRLSGSTGSSTRSARSGRRLY